MTTIAAQITGEVVTLAWDSQTTWGNQRYVSDDKVFQVGDVVLGVSGLVRDSDLLKHALVVASPKGWWKRRKARKAQLADPRGWVVRNVVPKVRQVLSDHGALEEYNGASSSNSHVLIVAPGYVGVLDMSFSLVDTLDDFVAIGSGSDYAYGAMAMGAGPEVAVQVASGFDVNTGGEVHTKGVKWR